MPKNVRIILSLLISFLLTHFVANIVYFSGTPKINLFKIKRLPKDISDQLTIFRTTFSYQIGGNKINYSNAFDTQPVNDILIARITPIVFDTPPPTPTLSPLPTEVVAPTFIPTPIEEPIISQTEPTEAISPTKIITPTKKPTPTVSSNQEALKISNPLSQPYYNPSLAIKCYNTNRFIQVYANGASTSNCYSAVKSAISSNLTSVSIMGRSIPIHKKAYPYFKAVSDELEKYKTSGGNYRFPSKTYRINSIGSYVFRCNVNSSTSGRNDLCSDGCRLSTHAFGIAVDINWETNANGSSSYDMPPEIVDIFESYGFRWGGRYKAIFGSTIDPMHFEFMYDLCKGITLII